MTPRQRNDIAFLLAGNMRHLTAEEIARTQREMERHRRGEILITRLRASEFIAALQAKVQERKAPRL